MPCYTPIQQQNDARHDFGEQHIRVPNETKVPVTSVYTEFVIRPVHRQGCVTTSFNVAWMVLTCLVAGTFLVGLVVNSSPTNSQPKIQANAIVLASYSAQNTSWLEELSAESVPSASRPQKFPSPILIPAQPSQTNKPSWRIHKYTLDDPSPALNTTIPRNQGREAMAYLTHIINNYANLAPYTIFLHGHSRSWHQPEPIAWKLRALSLDLLATEGYINLRCGLKPGCSADTILGTAHPGPRDHPKVRSMMAAFWAWSFQPEHRRWDFGPYPPELGQPCCAQFAVSRERILARPREFYEAYRRPMERDVREMQGVFGPLWTGYRMGILYEHLWHVVFGKEALFCPNPQFCRAVYFRDAIRCSNYTGDYEHRAGWKKIECKNTWDHAGMEFETGEVDRYGGWDGTKDPESVLEAVNDANVVAATGLDGLMTMQDEVTESAENTVGGAGHEVPDDNRETEAAAAVVQNFAAELHSLEDSTSGR